MINRLQIFLLFFIASCYPSPEVSGQFSQSEFDKMANKMAEGDAPDITISELKSNKEVVILDSREKNEYDISHIPNAKWVGYDNFDVKRITNIDKSQKIVVYCSVGYRSERITEKLMKAGYTNVYNLKGSIFQWVNEGNPIVDKNGKATKRIHGYNKKWSKWLNKGEIVY